MTVRDMLEAIVLKGGQTAILEGVGPNRYVPPVKLRRSDMRKVLSSEKAAGMLLSEVGMVDFARDHISITYRMQEET